MTQTQRRIYNIKIVDISIFSFYQFLSILYNQVYRIILILSIYEKKISLAKRKYKMRHEARTCRKSKYLNATIVSMDQANSVIENKDREVDVIIMSIIFLSIKYSRLSFVHSHISTIYFRRTLPSLYYCHYRQRTNEQRWF